MTPLLVTVCRLLGSEIGHYYSKVSDWMFPEGVPPAVFCDSAQTPFKCAAVHCNEAVRPALAFSSPNACSCNLMVLVLLVKLCSPLPQAVGVRGDTSSTGHSLCP